MESDLKRWSGKLALVTGASSGFGAAIVRELARRGINVVGVARRLSRVEELAEELKEAGGKVYPLKADLTKEEEIVAAFKWAEETLGPVQILVNNAGVSLLHKTIDCVPDNWRKVFNVNVIAPSVCVREYVKIIKKRPIEEGHIIFINSIAGNSIIPFPGFHAYSASKHALKVIAAGVRLDLMSEKLPVKVTTIYPGYGNTELFNDVKLSESFTNFLPTEAPALEANEVAYAVTSTLSQSPTVRISDMTIQAAGEIH